jgi:hypothetical protein
MTQDMQGTPGPEVMERMNLSIVGMTVELHRSWKALAALRGISMKDALLEALKLWCTMQMEKTREANVITGPTQ